MTEEGRYAAQVTIVKQECPDADENEIVEEFRRYEEEFLIPPEDALRSVVRKFQAATGMELKQIPQPEKAEKKASIQPTKETWKSPSLPNLSNSLCSVWSNI